MRINREHSQLLIIDIQEKLVPTVLHQEALIANTGRLIEAARRLGIPLTVSEHYPRGLGATVPALKEQFGNEAAVLDKVHFSCLREPNLRARLETMKAEGRHQVIVAGMEAHICVTQTVLDLLEEDFQSFVVADAVSARAAESIDLALERLRQAGCSAVNFEMVLFEWLDQAPTPEFKDLQRLVL